MTTDLLNSLYQKYNISDFSFGAIHDKLGDVYEDYCTSILNSKQYLDAVKTGNLSRLEHKILCCILKQNRLSKFNEIRAISATTNVPHRNNGGNSKTDIIATVSINNGKNIKLPISCKQSTAPKVALAEFDVDTICNEMGITNPRLKELLLKHQTDCSAKMFTEKEKKELTTLMKPIKTEFVRWVLTGSTTPDSNNICIPTSIIKFKLRKPAERNKIHVGRGDFELLSFEVLTIEECINSILYKNNGKIKHGGFGTGLSWTYATGSKGNKMQFKG